MQSCTQSNQNSQILETFQKKLNYNDTFLKITSVTKNIYKIVDTVFTFKKNTVIFLEDVK